MRCKFCDCPRFGFYGNATVEDLAYEVQTILQGEAVDHTDRFNVHFARMGEPTFNFNVLEFASKKLKPLVSQYVNAKTIHPVVSTMLPKSNKRLEEFVLKWCDIKNVEYNGEAGLQFSINSTDDAQRNDQFSGMSLSLNEISALAAKLPMPNGRKYTLNFAVTHDIYKIFAQLRMLRCHKGAGKYDYSGETVSRSSCKRADHSSSVL